MPTDDNPTVTFGSKQELEMVIRGLEDLRSLFEMRVEEAVQALDEMNKYEAEYELAIVNEALKSALG